jgi:hypothetical protein
MQSVEHPRTCGYWRYQNLEGPEHRRSGQGKDSAGTQAVPSARLDRTANQPGKRRRQRGRRRHQMAVQHPKPIIASENGFSNAVGEYHLARSADEHHAYAELVEGHQCSVSLARQRAEPTPDLQRSAHVREQCINDRDLLHTNWLHPETPADLEHRVVIAVKRDHRVDTVMCPLRPDDVIVITSPDELAFRND